MAWNIHWQCCFKSFNGTQYAVNIYEQNYIGEIVQLIGAEDPFVTQEDNDDDIFKPIRVQTGYLRIIDRDGTLMESIIPNNNTEKLVRLFQGSYGGIWPNGIFSEDSIKWQGFLCADAYTQPWEGQANIIEFPVKSFLSALKDVSISSNMAGTIYRFAGLFYYAFMSLTIDEAPYQTIMSISDLSNTSNWMKMFVEWGVFFSEEESDEQDVAYTILVGQTYYDVITAFCTTFGLMARESGNVLCFSMYDSGKYRIGTSSLTWTQIENYVKNGTNFYDNTNYIQDIEMFPQVSSSPLTFKGIDNTISFMIGARSAKIILGIKGMSKLLGLPGVVADSSTVYEVILADSGNGADWTAYLQPHVPRTNAIETFNFNRVTISLLSYQYYEEWIGYQTAYYWYYTQDESSSYSDFLAHSIMLSPTDVLTDGGTLFTGACPVRWFIRQNAESIILKDGLFLTLKTLTLFHGEAKQEESQYNIAYKIETSSEFSLSRGMLNINFNCKNIKRRLYHQTWEYPVIAGVAIGVKFGNMYWDAGSNAWTSDISKTYRFEIGILSDGTIATNKTEDMNVNKTDGYFIPIDSQMSGKITLLIYDGATNRMLPLANMVPLDARPRILYDLNVEFVYYNDVAASGRNENKYYRKILLSGFSEEKTITLKIGTYNNNLISPVFIRDILNTANYLQTVQYLTADEYHGTNERPEVHLLNRLEAYFGIVRRTLRATIMSGIDLIKKRYTYLGNTFFGIDAKHNWADDTQDVKFIEVTKDN